MEVSSISNKQSIVLFIHGRVFAGIGGIGERWGEGGRERGVGENEVCMIT